MKKERTKSSGQSFKQSLLTALKESIFSPVTVARWKTKPQTLTNLANQIAITALTAEDIEDFIRKIKELEEIMNTIDDSLKKLRIETDLMFRNLDHKKREIELQESPILPQS